MVLPSLMLTILEFDAWLDDVIKPFLFAKVTDKSH